MVISATAGPVLVIAKFCNDEVPAGSLIVAWTTPWHLRGVKGAGGKNPPCVGWHTHIPTTGYLHAAYAVG